MKNTLASLGLGIAVLAIDLAPTMLLAIAGAKKPARIEGEIFLGDNAAKPRTYVFGARDRCDETVFRFRM